LTGGERRKPFSVKNPDLFAGQPERVKKLKKAADKALREKARREWWQEHGNQNGKTEQKQR
jgi:hypothetical protein